MHGEISARIIRTILIYAESVGGAAAVDSLVEEAGVPKEELMDETAWVDHELEKRVLRRLVTVTGNENAPLEAGRFGIEAGAFGTLETVVRAFLEPKTVFRRIPWISNRVARVGVMEHVASRGRQAELAYRYHEGYRGTREMCLHRQGMLSGLPTTWGLPPAVVEEYECIHHGGECCRYRVRYKELPVARFRRAFVAVSAVIALLILLAVVLFDSDSGDVLLWALIVAVQMVLLGGFMGFNLDTAYRSGQQHHVIRRQHRALGRQLVQMEAVNTRLEERVQARTAELEHEVKRIHSLSELTRELAECLEVGDAISTTFAGATDLLGASGISLAFKEATARELAIPEWDAESNGVVRYSENGLWVYTLGAVPVDVGAERAAFWPHAERIHLSPATARAGASLSVLLTSGGSARGVLSLWREKEGQRFSGRDIDICRTFGDTVAASLMTIQMLREKERLAIIDGLTGLCVHRHFREVMDIEIERARRYGQPLTLVLVDLDDFKHVNDTMGHLAGDEVLRAVGRAMKIEVRSTDIAARYGGDEFAILLPGVGRDQGRFVAERLRDRISGHVVELDDKQVAVTVSLGIAEYEKGDDANALIERADRGLYGAKSEGKNRVFTHVA